MKAAVIDIHMFFFYVPQRVLYLDDLSNTDNPYFDLMVVRIYPPELQLNKANESNTEAPYLEYSPGAPR